MYCCLDLLTTERIQQIESETTTELEITIANVKYILNFVRLDNTIHNTIAKSQLMKCSLESGFLRSF